VPASATSVDFSATVESVNGNKSVTLTATAGGVSRTFILQLSSGTQPGSSLLTVNATSISFGDVAVNTSATQSVTLTSSGALPVNISALSTSGAEFTSTGLVAPASLSPGQSVVVNIQFGPTAAGAASGALTISSDASNNSAMSIPLTGNGVTRAVQLNWDAPDSGAPGAGYRIYRSPSGASQFQSINPAAVSDDNFVDSAVQSGQSYDYYVTAVDGSGAESMPSNTATVAIPND
jgi:hypothetical protein